MIRRDAGHDFLLISQTDHARLAEQLAEHLGNGRFTKSVKGGPLLQAIGLHDSGWPLHDDQPTLNDRGYPLDVFEVPREIALKVWAASADRAEQIDRYAGLLVSLHSLSLSIYATSESPSKNEKFGLNQMQDQFEINKFQHREIERQEQLRTQLGFRTDLPLKHGLAEAGASVEDQQLRFDFRLLQAMDLLSLCLCCSKMPAEQTNDVLRSPTASPMKLRITKSLDGTVHVAPWPFDSKRIELTVRCRRVPAKRFSTVEEFREVFAAAEVVPLKLPISM